MSTKGGKSTQFDNQIILVLQICSQFKSENIKSHSIFNIDTVILRKSIDTVHPEELYAPCCSQSLSLSIKAELEHYEHWTKSWFIVACGDTCSRLIRKLCSAIAEITFVSFLWFQANWIGLQNIGRHKYWGVLWKGVGNNKDIMVSLNFLCVIKPAVSKARPSRCHLWMLLSWFLLPKRPLPENCSTGGDECALGRK